MRTKTVVCLLLVCAVALASSLSVVEEARAFRRNKATALEKAQAALTNLLDAECQKIKSKCNQMVVYGPVGLADGSNLAGSSSSADASLPDLDQSLKPVDEWINTFKKRNGMIEGDMYSAARSVVRPLINRMKQKHRDMTRALQDKNEEIRDALAEAATQNIYNAMRRAQIADEKAAFNQETAARRAEEDQTIKDLQSARAKEDSEAVRHNDALQKIQNFDKSGINSDPKSIGEAVRKAIEAAQTAADQAKKAQDLAAKAGISAVANVAATAAPAATTATTATTAASASSASSAAR